MKEKIKSFLKWLYPGMNVKRWILLMVLGLTLLALGLMVIIDFTTLGAIKRFIIDFIIVFMKGNFTFPNWLVKLIALLYFFVGIFFIIFGFQRLLNSLFTALLKEKRSEVVNIVHKYRFKKKLKKVVTIGGGTGMSTILRGLREYPFYPVAIVTVTDDGGSSGKLREELGIPPPGDIRNCIVSLSESEEFLKELFQYRFKEGESLQGHSIGNLLIAGSIKLKDSLLYGIKKLEEALNLYGKVIPVSETILTLKGEFEDGEIVYGETNIRKKRGKIKNISFEPFYAKPTYEAINEIQNADLIVIGPGSLFTSIIPPLLFNHIVEAIKESKAKKIYILNLMTENGETDNFTASMHVEKIYEYTKEKIFDYIIVNTGKISDYYLNKYKEYNSFPVEIDEDKLKKLNLKIIKDDYVTVESGYLRHNPHKIYETLKKNYEMENIDYYTNIVKRDILRTKPKDLNETISEIQGFLLTCGNILLSKDRTGIVFVLSLPELSRRVVSDSNQIFPEKKEIKLRKIKGRNFIEVLYYSKIEDLIKLGLIDEKDLKVHFKPRGEGSIKSFLRGAFLGSGTIRDPKKGYYLEIRFNKESSYYEFYEIAKVHHFNFKEREKSIYKILYLQNKDDIKEFLLFIGASHSFFSLFENSLIKDMRNELTKNLNYELKNLKKTVDAYIKARDAIIYIKEKGFYKKLTPALKEIVDLRLKYPDLSLSELAIKLGVTKSCINHRLRRIIKIAERLKNEE